MRSPVVLSLLLVLLAACGAKRAVSASEAALMRDPASADAWVALGEAHRRGGAKPDAVRAYTRALELEPGHPGAKAGLARTGGSELSELERQALLNPLDDEVWGDVGDLYAARGDREVALRHYLYALRLDPTDREWHEKVVRLGGGAVALAVIEENTDLDDDEEVGDLADLLVEIGERDRACTLYERANQLDPSDGEWVEKLRSVCGVAVEGSAMVGAHGIGEFLSRETTSAPGVAALAAGQPDQALASFRHALSQDPTDKEALYGLVVTSGRTASEILAELAEGSSNDELWGDLGDAWLEIGELGKARAAYERARALDPGDGEWRTKLELLDAAQIADPR